MRKATTGRSREKKSTRGLAARVRAVLNMPYMVELTPLSAADGGGYLARIPLLRGCQSDGRTPDEAVRNVREAQRAWIESAIRHNDPIPLPQ